MPFPKPFYRWRPHPWHGLEVGPEPQALVDRLRHYFSTCKLLPDEKPHTPVGPPYVHRHAERVIQDAMADYDHEYGAD